MSNEIIRSLDLIQELVHSGTDEIVRALEAIEKRAHMPDIDVKEITLMLAYQMKLNLLLSGEQAMGELITQEELSLLEGESLRKVSKEDIQKWREQIERHKAELRKMIEKDRENVKSILEDAGMGK